jgi:hypothetical protein
LDTFEQCQSCELETEHEAAHRVDPQDTAEQGWPGDGSGTDDLADYNANEAMDYCDE